MQPLSWESVKPLPVPTSELRTKFKRRLITWFRRHGRDLPWRRTRDPYRVLVAEIMLQQTQVSRVEGYWPRFLATYPTIHHLARATPARVRESWTGLGYYQLAANLHRLARDVVTNHGGELPPDAATLQSLPGVGTYTAGRSRRSRSNSPNPQSTPTSPGCCGGYPILTSWLGGPEKGPCMPPPRRSSPAAAATPGSPTRH